MKRTNLPANLQQLLKTTQYVAIATVCPNGQPWNTPVVGRFDDNLNLYWVSWQENRHSRNIASEPRVFVVIYDTSQTEGEGFGLYMQMLARPLETPTEVKAASVWYDFSFFRLQNDELPTFVGNCPSRVYKAVPQKIWHNADARRRGHFIDVRRELSS